MIQAEHLPQAEFYFFFFFGGGKNSIVYKNEANEKMHCFTHAKILPTFFFFLSPILGNRSLTFGRERPFVVPVKIQLISVKLEVCMCFVAHG